MRNGMWAISRWNIRMPMMVLTPKYDGMRVIDRTLQIDSIQVTGGELVTAVANSARGRDTVWVRPAVRLRGTVLDSASAEKSRTETRRFRYVQRLLDRLGRVVGQHEQQTAQPDRAPEEVCHCIVGQMLLRRV